jgi:hypothetical protein
MKAGINYTLYDIADNQVDDGGEDEGENALTVAALLGMRDDEMVQ